ncbi:hypothetical protein TVAG_244500 [Trichomonas vaginalis G3]|uniref:Mar1 transposase n=1 Tax=Trichomonas vaginalis (strain ATCC PRA-98 / G3) TaxID=412133 RepID=A2ES37_TRIV3|nr:hypothetical protein TVAGG3_0689980 [Trichomonas vaginalis G3]EAY04549.1 hypothetical protein TVAG_244500 [Trichomonas vaginalis G3]KAI5508497.1 hypothetical protein TVAGG3_0689980 [Trichomonas vaginalis G3]|eukprot:XP_001316772.1 hypothetical protein [Trichomonas vaginalis G3]
MLLIQMVLIFMLQKSEALAKTHGISTTHCTQKMISLLKTPAASSSKLKRIQLSSTSRKASDLPKQSRKKKRAPASQMIHQTKMLMSKRKSKYNFYLFQLLNDCYIYTLIFLTCKFILLAKKPKNRK